jgi:uncharacterized repeat protein (TIGR02543 family)
MKKSIFSKVGIVAAAAFFCVGCNDGGDNDNTNGEADAFLKWINDATYTIKFYENYGSYPTATTVTANYATVITLESSIKRGGYLFTGWNTESNGTGTAYSAGSRYNVTDNINFYAMWIYIDMVSVEGGFIRNQDGSVTKSDIDFSIGRYEVTQKLWKAVMGNNNPSNFTGNDSLPVERVSWDDVQKFISTLNDRTGEKYRLPTAAEWEFAARSGINANGNIINVDNVAWHIGNSENKTHIVGTKQSNTLNIYDMFGNVREWVDDKFGELETDTGYLIYGGSFSEEVDMYSRTYGTQSYRDNDLGFRLAK